MNSRKNNDIISKKVIRVFAKHLGFDDPRDILKDMLLEDDLLIEEEEYFDIQRELEEIFDLNFSIEVTNNFKTIDDIIKYINKEWIID